MPASQALPGNSEWSSWTGNADSELMRQAEWWTWTRYWRWARLEETMLRGRRRCPGMRADEVEDMLRGDESRGDRPGS